MDRRGLDVRSGRYGAVPVWGWGGHFDLSECSALRLRLHWRLCLACGDGDGVGMVEEHVTTGERSGVGKFVCWGGCGEDVGRPRLENE